jgi:glycerate kinase
VELLDAGLRNWASVLRQSTGRDVNVPGAGAAGGFPASFLAFGNARLEGGFELVADLTGLAGKLAQADLVITGEGSLDSQSLTGKAPIALADAARGLGIPVIVVAGRILVTQEDLARHGVVGAAQLLDLAGSPADAVANAAKYLTWATSQVLEGA